MYKLSEGACPKSHGMNVAKMANVRSEILARATDISEKFESIISKMWKQSEGEEASTAVFKELMTNLVMTRDDVIQLWEFVKTL